MQDSTFIYIDFILTIQRLATTITALLKKECFEMQLEHINFDQVLYMMYLIECKDIEYIEERKINKKNFYYTVNRLRNLGYIDIESEGKFIKTINSTDKSKQIINKLHHIFEKHIRKLLFNGMVITELSHILTLIYRFEKFWVNQINITKNSIKNHLH